MVEVHDKRKRVAVKTDPSEKKPVSEEAAVAAEEPQVEDVDAPQAPTIDEQVRAPEHDYLEDLKRVQAEFDNYRKRHRDEQGRVRARITSALLEGLLPVLDNFERALEHGTVDSGIELVYKQLQEALAQHGLEEVPAEGKPFDPAVHEAVESVEDPSVTSEVCKTVYRRGYRVADHLIRPAMVVVARPAEDPAPESVESRDERSTEERDQEAG
ncbi:MAG TPA: nucleotide exchange factor GrpE [Actinomycetota bacterium]|nr:nucleotide exchange factor GrpE [Actinomycetota bacterium]